MNHRENFTGQWIDYRERNDNAPARYSAPSADFKAILAGYANPYCTRCSGKGYIGRFKHVCAGRCFKCISDTAWDRAQKTFEQAYEIQTDFNEIDELYLAVCGDEGGSAYLCGGMWITPEGEIYDVTDNKVNGSAFQSISQIL